MMKKRFLQFLGRKERKNKMSSLPFITNGRQHCWIDCDNFEEVTNLLTLLKALRRSYNLYTGTDYPKYKVWLEESRSTLELIKELSKLQFKLDKNHYKLSELELTNGMRKLELITDYPSYADTLYCAADKLSVRYEHAMELDGEKIYKLTLYNYNKQDKSTTKAFSDDPFYTNYEDFKKLLLVLGMEIK